MPTVLTSPAEPTPDPPKDPPTTTASSNIEALLIVARYLLGYGRHLIDTIRQRAAAPNFSAIAANFGTAKLSTILAHLNRGILRCMALERILLARQATGKDIEQTERTLYDLHEMFAREAEPQPEQPQPPAAPATAEEPAPKRAPRPSRPAGWDDPELFMPTLEDLERQMRRQPIGRILLAIILDLGVVPGFCLPEAWSLLADIMNDFGGGNAIIQLVKVKTDRRKAFDKEQDRNPKADWSWVNMTREAMRQALGFFIGEPPVNPLDPSAALATAPP